MVALNQHFAILATFCSLAAMSIFPLPANAAAIQQRAPVGNGGPGRHGSPAAPFLAANHKSRKGKQRKGRALPWSPISNVLRLADIAIGSAKRHYYEDAVDVHIPDFAEIIVDKRHGHEAQAHFHQMRDTEAHVSHRDHAKRRSSVSIPSNRGGSYVVSPGRRSLHAGQGKTAKRQEEKGGVPGRIDLVGSTSGSQEKLGSLYLQTSTRILNASDKNFTRAYLVNAQPGVSSFSTPSGQDSEVFVSLQFPFFDPSQPSIVPYCATINGKAASIEPQPMTVEKCFDKDQGNSADQESQTFAYNGKTGVIRPIGYAGQDNSKSSDPSTSNNAGTTGVTSVIGGRDEVGKPVSAQNVTLIFVPDAPEVAHAEEDIVTATSTMTTTITVTSMSTATSSASAADIDPTSTVAPVTSSSVPSSSAAPSSTSKSPMVTPTSVASAAAFNVQVVGLNSTSSSDPTVASTTLTSDSTVPTTSVVAQDVSSASAVASTTVTSNSTTPTTSINAADVAASIAASDASSSAVRTSTVTVEVTSSAAVPTAAAVESPMTSEAGSSSVPTMTPVSTAPSQMVFKADSRL